MYEYVSKSQVYHNYDILEILQLKVFDAKTRYAKITWNSDLVKLPYFYDNVTKLFLSKIYSHTIVLII